MTILTGDAAAQAWPGARRIALGVDDGGGASSHAGVRIGFNPTRGLVVLSAWYDTMCGTGEIAVPLGELLAALGITEKDLATRGKSG